MWRLCYCLWRCGLSLRQPVVPPVDAGSSHWQHLSLLVSIPHEYTCWVCDEYTRIAILTHKPWDQMADNFDIDHQRIYASPEQIFCIAPLYHSRKISLCICIYFIKCIINVILTYDFMYKILSLSLEIPLCSYHSSYDYYLYRSV